MKVIALYNLKGGVGKTAAAVNLSYLSARDGYRTLVWDLDAQGAASFYFRIQPESSREATKLLAKKKSLHKALRETDYEGLDIIPADLSFRNLDLDLNDYKKATTRLRRLLGEVEDDYDITFLDCAPSMSVAAENVFNMAGVLLVPVIPTHLSLRAFDQVLKFRDSHPVSGGDVLPFFSMVDRRKRLHRDLIIDFAARYPSVLTSYIPYASDIERMGTQRAPVNAFADASAGGRAFRAMWSNLRDRVGLSRVN